MLSHNIDNHIYMCRKINQNEKKWCLQIYTDSKKWLHATRANACRHGWYRQLGELWGKGGQRDLVPQKMCQFTKKFMTNSF